MNYDRAAVRTVLDQARTEGRTALTAPEGKLVCEAYGIPVPNEGLATSAQDAVRLAQEIGYPVVLKIVSTDILHKTEAGGVLTGLASAVEVEQGYSAILANARAYQAEARILGVQVQQMLPAAQEVIVGVTPTPALASWWPLGWAGCWWKCCRISPSVWRRQRARRRSRCSTISPELQCYAVYVGLLASTARRWGTDRKCF